jgi:hypothetical protein
MLPAALPAGAPEPDGGSLAGAHEFLPSPLAGEGLGERGPSAKTSVVPPLPNPSPTRGEGQNSLGLGEVPGRVPEPELSCLDRLEARGRAARSQGPGSRPDRPLRYHAPRAA